MNVEEFLAQVAQQDPRARAESSRLALEQAHDERAAACARVAAGREELRGELRARLDGLPPERRADGWANLLTGLGSSRDATRATEWLAQMQLPYQLLVEAYKFDPLAARVVNVIPRECLREGYEVLTPERPELAERLTSKGEALAIDRHIQDGEIWGRLFGGGIAHLEIADGRPDCDPVDIENVGGIVGITDYDLRRVVPWEWYPDRRGRPDWSRPKSYMITTLSGAIDIVHESRCIVFRGAHTDTETRYALNGWDLSVLDAVIDTVKGFWECHAAARHLVSEASIGVLKLKGLRAALAGGNREPVQDRLELLDRGKSIVRSLALDEGEEFSRVHVLFAGLPEVLVQEANLLSAATEIPVTLLMGQAPAGLNATGDADLRAWYDRIAGMQKRDILPVLRRLYGLMARASGYAGPIEIRFRSLWQETPAERAETRKVTADTDAIYLDRKVLTPETVRRSRFGPDGWQQEMVEPEETKSAEVATVASVASTSADAATLELAPTDLAIVVTVNEARASAGLGPLTRQGVPDPAGALTVAEYKARNAETLATAAAAEEGAAPPPEAPPPAGPIGGAPPVAAAAE